MHCGSLDVHEPHPWTVRGRWEAREAAAQRAVRAPHPQPRWRVDPDEQHQCPGIGHDHATRCCAEHRAHVTPHVGCVLR